MYFCGGSGLLRSMTKAKNESDAAGEQKGIFKRDRAWL